ncbi:hypothetical protein SISSUDRAFT_1062238 [Sistotremastrum suecicum HHB10207 ss-3]|uniref:Uncharacterized protein n=1 Tax=Sistotremastrum suecicum HHB10207 ss-3 TaxID=1314776 RepID=A0A166D4A4_9AGAM|nr:hypothetical protein SISSUDRAFT_1062238 [Sistotremastrum suecicum HHB10207 ss-3]
MSSELINDISEYFDPSSEDRDPTADEKITAKFSELCTSWAASNKEFDDSFIDLYFSEIKAFMPRTNFGNTGRPNEWHASAGFGQPQGVFDRILINRTTFTSTTTQGTRWAIGGRAYITGRDGMGEHTFTVTSEREHNIIRIVGTQMRGPGRVEFIEKRYERTLLQTLGTDGRNQYPNGPSNARSSSEDVRTRSNSSVDQDTPSEPAADEVQVEFQPGNPSVKVTMASVEPFYRVTRDQIFPHASTLEYVELLYEGDFEDRAEHFLLLNFLSPPLLPRMETLRLQGFQYMQYPEAYDYSNLRELILTDFRFSMKISSQGMKRPFPDNRPLPKGHICPRQLQRFTVVGWTYEDATQLFGAVSFLHSTAVKLTSVRFFDEPPDMQTI